MKLRWSYHVAQVVLELILFLTPQILGLQAKISVLKKSLASHHGEIPFNPSVRGEAAIISINQVCHPSSLSYGMNPGIIASSFLRVKGVFATLDLGRRVKSQGQKMPGASAARCSLCGLGLLVS